MNKSKESELASAERRGTEKVMIEFYYEDGTEVMQMELCFRRSFFADEDIEKIARGIRDKGEILLRQYKLEKIKMKRNL